MDAMALPNLTMQCRLVAAGGAWDAQVGEWQDPQSVLKNKTDGRTILKSVVGDHEAVAARRLRRYVS